MQLGTKSVSSIGKTLMFGSVVKVRVRFRQVVIVVRVRVSVQEINTSLCKYPKSYLSKPVYVCVCMLMTS